MSLGLHLALTTDELAALRGIAADELYDYIGDPLETEKFEADEACETDKSWSIIHAALNGVDPDGPLQIEQAAAGGDRSDFVAGDARYAISGTVVFRSDDDGYVGLVDAAHVPAVAAALNRIDTEELGRQVRLVHAKFDADADVDEAADYAMSWYPGLVEFYDRAGKAGQHVIFTVNF